MTRTTTRLCAAVLAATTGLALVACGSNDDTSDTTTDQAIETNMASDDSGTSVDDLDLLTPGDTEEISAAGDGPGRYTLTVDNVTDQGSDVCADMVWTVENLDTEVDGGMTDDYLIAELGMSGSPSPEVHLVQGGSVADDATHAPADEDFDTDAMTVTQHFCVDVADADADGLVVEAGPDALASSDIDGWRIDL